VLTVAHWAHLLIGLVVLLVLLLRAAQGRYSAMENTGIWQGTLYWHFLGGLWIYLLLFLSFVH
jgi:cytochrome c oxidase subunit III